MEILLWLWFYNISTFLLLLCQLFFFINKVFNKDFIRHSSCSNIYIEGPFKFLSRSSLMLIFLFCLILTIFQSVFFFTIKFCSLLNLFHLSLCLRTINKRSFSTRIVRWILLCPCHLFYLLPSFNSIVISPLSIQSKLFAYSLRVYIIIPTSSLALQNLHLFTFWLRLLRWASIPIYLNFLLI